MLVESVVFGLARLAVEPALRKVIDALKAKKAVKAADIVDLPIIVVEVGRPITGDVKQQFGEKSVVATISAIREISVDEFPQFAVGAYKAIAEVARSLRAVNRKKIGLVLSGPVAMNFQLGQLIGLSHFDIQVFHWSAGEYIAVPPVRREMLK